MKLFAIILSLYTITLSALPCDDDIENASGQLTSIVESSDFDYHGFFDNCSPFCSCVCCSVISTEKSKSFNKQDSVNYSFEINTNYYNYYSSNYFSRILRPPIV
jgi:hypothetical protein